MASLITKSIRKARGNRYRRRRAAKRAAKPVLKNSVSMGLGFPKKLCTTLKYSTTKGLSLSAGALNNTQFVINGLFDPDYTGSGHKAFMFNEIMKLYNHYTVIGAKMTVRCFHQQGSTAVPVRVCLWQNDDATVVPNNMDTFKEQSKSRSSMLVDGTTPKRSQMYWSLRKTFGKIPVGSPDYRGTVIANPTEQSVFVISAQPVDQVSTASIWCEVDIQFITVFSELKDIVGS